MNFDVKSWLRKNQGDATLLGICPMSEEIIRASIREASEEGFTPMFVATPRQVDGDRGYTGWSQEGLVDFIRSTAEESGYAGPWLVARDHGGPYQSTRDRDKLEVDLAQAMEYAKETFYEDLKAGFDIIHVDTTEDPRVSGTLNLEEVARRTSELIAFIENSRKEENLSEVFYEVGTEEISGGMTEPKDFERFIELLREKLSERKEDLFEKIIFIVGQVGTTMRIDMTNNFDPEQAETLVNIASEHDLFLKVHYTDWLETPTLEKFPDIGIGAANVGPEFAASIVKALDKLEEREGQALSEAGKEGERSKLMETIEDAAVKESPWKKFAPEALGEGELEEFAEDNRRNIALCVGRYVMNSPEVRKSRQKLQDNLKKHTSVDNPDQFIVKEVKGAIDRYVKAFNLQGRKE